MKSKNKGRIKILNRKENIQKIIVLTNLELKSKIFEKKNVEDPNSKIEVTE